MNNKTTFVAETLLPTRHGFFRLRGYKHTVDNGKTYSEPSAIIVGDVKGKEQVAVRVHDACFTSEVLGSLKCDCADQLCMALQHIQANPPGVVIYLQQEGRGIGLANKIAAYSLQELGVDTVDANRLLGLPDDSREYSSVRNILDELGVKSVRLMTNNPRKLCLLTALGVKVVGRLPCLAAAGEFSQRYLETKRSRMAHLINSLPAAPASATSSSATTVSASSSTSPTTASATPYSSSAATTTSPPTISPPTTSPPTAAPHAASPATSRHAVHPLPPPPSPNSPIPAPSSSSSLTATTTTAATTITTTTITTAAAAVPSPPALPSSSNPFTSDDSFSSHSLTSASATGHAHNNPSMLTMQPADAGLSRPAPLPISDACARGGGAAGMFKMSGVNASSELATSLIAAAGQDLITTAHLQTLLSANNTHLPSFNAVNNTHLPSFNAASNNNNSPTTSSFSFASPVVASNSTPSSPPGASSNSHLNCKAAVLVSVTKSAPSVVEALSLKGGEAGRGRGGGRREGRGRGGVVESPAAAVAAAAAAASTFEGMERDAGSLVGHDSDEVIALINAGAAAATKKAAEATAQKEMEMWNERWRNKNATLLGDKNSVPSAPPSWPEVVEGKDEEEEDDEDGNARMNMKTEFSSRSMEGAAEETMERARMEQEKEEDDDEEEEEEEEEEEHSVTKTAMMTSKTAMMATKTAMVETPECPPPPSNRPSLPSWRLFPPSFSSSSSSPSARPGNSASASAYAPGVNGDYLGVVRRLGPATEARVSLMNEQANGKEGSDVSNVRSINDVSSFSAPSAAAAIDADELHIAGRASKGPRLSPRSTAGALERRSVGGEFLGVGGGTSSSSSLLVTSSPSSSSSLVTSLRPGSETLTEILIQRLREESNSGSSSSGRPAHILSASSPSYSSLFPRSVAAEGGEGRLAADKLIKSASSSLPFLASSLSSPSLSSASLASSAAASVGIQVSSAGTTLQGVQQQGVLGHPQPSQGHAAAQQTFNPSSSKKSQQSSPWPLPCMPCYA